jgi:O-antigen/teichoic acid export membrane protein
LRKNFFCNLAANVVLMGSRWAVVVVLAKFGNAEMIGALMLALAVSAPFIALANLALRNAMTTDVQGEYRFGDYLAVRLVASLLAMIGICATVGVVGYEPRLALIILVVALSRVFELLSDVFFGLFQKHERMDWIAVSCFLRESVAIGLLAAGVALTGELLWGVLALPLAFAASFFCYDLRKARWMRREMEASVGEARRAELDSLRLRWHGRSMLRLIWTTVPLGIVMMLISLLVSIPRYVVGHYMGEHVLGIFGAIGALTTSGAIIVTALGNSTSPRMAKQFAAGEFAAYWSLLLRQLGLVACMGAAAVSAMAMVGGPILTVLYDAEIGQYTRLAVYLMIAAVLINLNGPLGRALDATRRFPFHLAVRLLNVLVLLALLPALVSRQGMEGAAMAMIVSTLVSAVAYVAAICLAIRQRRSGA